MRRGARAVLDELSGILNVMRRPDEPSSSTDPLPTLDQLDQLISGFTALGLEVEISTTGTPLRPAPAVALAAYRIIQESLTNAHRHGRRPHAQLHIAYTAETLTVEVVNDAGTDRPPTGRRGHGITGMRERVAAAGGTIDIGPTTDGRFRVRATLPMNSYER